MSIRTEKIAAIFQAWLKRYSPPKMMATDVETQKAERNSLLRVLLKFAPADEYEGWVNRALDSLEYQMKTRAWPTKGELGSVCSNLRKDAFTPAANSGSDWSLDQKEINAKRMNAGEAVGDDWIYGRKCVEMMAAGLVSQDTLRKYRSAYYFSLKDSLGDEGKARSIEGQMIAKHEAAEGAYRERDDGKRFVAPTYRPKTFGNTKQESAA